MPRINQNFKFIKLWLILVFSLTLVGGVVYLSAQQNYRLSANDPQIQMSENPGLLVNALNKDTLNSQGHNLLGPDIDIEQDLTPFILVFDGKATQLLGNVNEDKYTKDNGQSLAVPSGVFEYTRVHGQDRFTWQPHMGLRIAAVVTYFKDQNGFVLAGRSLREVESRESLLLKQVEVWWIVSVLVSLVFAYILEKFKFS